MTDDFELNERAHAWIKGMRGQFDAGPQNATEPEAAD